MSERTDQVLETIRHHIAAEGYAPTVREIAEKIGLGSTSTVHYHLTRLADAGRISWKPGANRTIRIIEEVPAC